MRTNLQSKEILEGNHQIAVDALKYACKSHYDGVHTIYRMAACVLFEENVTDNEIFARLQRLSEELKVLDVRANRIMVYDDMLEIDFYPKRSLMVMNKGQYAGLMLQFADFLEKSGLEDMFIQSGMYDDDPGDKIYPSNEYLVNHFPEFNSICFGSCNYEQIEVVDFSTNFLTEEGVA